MQNDVSDVVNWLRDLGLERYAQAFLDAEITRDVLPELTEEDLRELGLPLGPRKLVLKAVQALAGPSTPPPPSQVAPPAPEKESAPEASAERRQLTVMFVDLVGSTALSSQFDPGELRELIRSYQQTVAAEIARFEGHIAKFLGDGVLALFGVATEPATASRQAIRAAALIAGNVDRFNRLFKENLGEPVGFGIGIHGGEVILGDIGYSDHRVFTAIGDAVNVTARLQEQTKMLKCEVVLSEDVCRDAGIALDALPAREIALRGREEPMHVRIVSRAAMLEGLVREVA